MRKWEEISCNTIPRIKSASISPNPIQYPYAINGVTYAVFRVDIWQVFIKGDNDPEWINDDTDVHVCILNRV